MHDLHFIQDLATVMLIAGLTTVIFQRLRQPVVLGYIIAGVLVGPYTFPVVFIHDEKTIRTLSELGMILLLFALGLEFSPHFGAEGIHLAAKSCLLDAKCIKLSFNRL